MLLSNQDACIYRVTDDLVVKSRVQILTLKLDVLFLIGFTETGLQVVNVQDRQGSW